MNDINALARHSPNGQVNNLFKSCLQSNHSFCRKNKVYSVKSSKTTLQKEPGVFSVLEVTSGPRPESSIVIV